MEIYRSALNGCSPVFFTHFRATLAPRIHHRLPRDIRHRYSRDRPGYLHRPGAAAAPTPTATPGLQVYEYDIKLATTT